MTVAPVWYALSVRQPFAHLILSGQKQYESRTWCPTVLGAIIIHASASPMSCVTREAAIMQALARTGVDRVDALPRGKIVGVVVVDSIIQPGDTQQTARLSMRQRLLCSADGDVDDFYLWKMTKPSFLPPTTIRGALGLWPVPASVVRKLGNHL